MKLNWFLDIECDKMRLEIINNTLVVNSGVIYNGTWKYGVFRKGQIKSCKWENGVIYNGHFSNVNFKNGIIFEGKFFNSVIENGEIRGGAEFYNCKISDTIKRHTSKDITINAKNDTANDATTDAVNNTKPQPVKESFIKKFDEFLK